MNFTDAAQMFWPLSVLLLALVILRRIEADLRPIATNVVKGVAQNAQQNALGYAMALIMATLASLQALTEVATQMGWNHVAAAGKILQPGLAAVVSYAMNPRSPIPAPTKPPGTTTAPFPPTT